jgi:uncharacterized membrane protein (UPF0127 family)
VIRGRVYRADSRECVIPQAARTGGMFERMRGLLGRAPLRTGEALLIVPCASVHTFGMRYTLDLAFLDRDWRVVRTVPGVMPWRMAACPAAAMVLELPEGGLAAAGIRNGDRLVWEND